MKLRSAWYTLGVAFALTTGQSWADHPTSTSTGHGGHHGQRGTAQPYCPPGTTMPGTGIQPPAPGQPGALPRDAFVAEPSERGGGAARSAIPNLFGDLPASFVRGPLTVTLLNGQVVTLQRGQPIPAPFNNSPGARFNFDIQLQDGSILQAGRPYPADQNLPIANILPFESLSGAGILGLTGRGAFKITENESPRPQDRVYTTYNYFNGVNGIAPPGVARTDIHREVIGFEKTFLDGNASFGMRVPFIQIQGDGSIRQSDIGDLSFVFKYAFLNNSCTGNVLSGGLVVTAPTGESFLPPSLDVHNTLLQPFVGGIYKMGDFFVQGFSSLAIPVDSRDVTYFFNDLAAGYILYNAGDQCDQLITSVVPIFEIHVTTPLNNRAITETIQGIHIVDLTFGTTLGIGQKSTLNLGIVTPITGPRPFDFEAQVQFNYRF